MHNKNDEGQLFIYRTFTKYGKYSNYIFCRHVPDPMPLFYDRPIFTSNPPPKKKIGSLIKVESYVNNKQQRSLTRTGLTPPGPWGTTDAKPFQTNNLR